jgi:hypothetical protein
MNRQNRTRILGPALLVAAALSLPDAARAAGDPSIVHVDGYLNSQGGRCLTLREHDGKLYNLVGAVGGLQTGDHVRVEGRFVDGSGCGTGTGVNVNQVQAIWADDHHRTTYYDQLQNGSFADWAAANRGYNPRSGRGGYGRDGRDRGNYDRNGSYDRNGGYDRNYRSDRSQDLRRVSGRVQGYRGDCLMVRGDDGHTYGLTGDVRGNDGRGDRVRVLGFLGRGVCGSRTVEVQEVR